MEVVRCASVKPAAVMSVLHLITPSMPRARLIWLKSDCLHFHCCFFGITCDSL